MTLRDGVGVSLAILHDRYGVQIRPIIGVNWTRGNASADDGFGDRPEWCKSLPHLVFGIRLPPLVRGLGLKAALDG